MRRATLSDPPRFALVSRQGGHVILAADTGAVAHVYALEDDLMRLLLLPRGRLEGPPSWAVAPGRDDLPDRGRDRFDRSGFSNPDIVLSQADGTLRLETSRMRLEIRLHGFRCTWFQRDRDGWRPMAVDRPTQAYDFGWWDGRVHHYVARRAGERYFGLGERAGDLDRAGRRFRLRGLDPMGYDAETSDPLYKSIPYVLVADAEGACHGAFYDTMADATFDFGRELDNYHGLYRSMVAERGDLDLYMIAGPDPAAVTRRFTWLTGRPALMPRWSLGYSGSTMTYTDAPDAQARMAEFLEQLARHDIGCSSFHLSSGYTSIGDKRYVFHWNRDKFPDPAAFVRSYAEAGIHLVPNIKPALLASHPRFAEVAAAGGFVRDDDGKPVEAQFWDEVGAYIDFTDARGAAWWRAGVTRALLEQGIRASWNDNNEYEIWDARARFAFFGTPRPAAEARPLQSLLMARASRRAQQEARPDERPYVVTRCAMAGHHRYAQTWTGDNRTDWKTIRFNAKMGIGLALSGVSNCGHDVGGFAGRRPEPELFLRWVQAGVMMPRFSIHSWNDDGTVNEPWMYPELLPAIRRLMALRQRLIPFFYDLLLRYRRDYEPITRPLWLDAPGDPDAWAENDEHLLGPNLLVAPVFREGETERRLRLPAGRDWIDVWTGAVHTGGAEATMSAPLDGPPVLLARASSGIFVDLARGGFRPGPYRRGMWLFPPVEGAFLVEALEDEGDGFGPLDRWVVEGRSETGRVVVTVRREGPGTWSDDTLTLLLPPGDGRSLEAYGNAAEPVATPDGRRGLRLALT